VFSLARFGTVLVALSTVIAATLAVGFAIQYTLILSAIVT
jgi:hypothetical protein